MKAFIEIKIEAGSNILSIISALKNIEGVKDATAVTGHADILLSIESPDLNTLADTITNKIHAIRGVENTETMICVE
ncbi:MAG: Lrp/AsnC family transcriptional regulator [Candidatus Nitrosothermus koennekii]|nr:MAG: Lrp/AsnC family transcriptional regulator [Candidatus Nitrosothermus koennekii]